MLTLLIGKQSRVSLSPSSESPQTLATVSTDNALDVTITVKYAYIIADGILGVRSSIFRPEAPVLINSVTTTEA